MAALRRGLPRLLAFLCPPLQQHQAVQLRQLFPQHLLLRNPKQNLNPLDRRPICLQPHQPVLQLRQLQPAPLAPEAQ
ncbi:hypothetical protein AVEN_104378-1 [Araneus ventricosus]|uniref:Uncharacterized protein n=1 Tax=Araneus ventricosus TaxID=182803 RepID=A0A4Y2MB11_ARAVE|nr:hypothetical protein AVEN_104378-1 [Araneus ventricosus]